MEFDHLTYHLRIDDLATVRVEKRGLGNELLGEPVGTLRFVEGWDRLAVLMNQASAGVIEESLITELGNGIFEAVFDARLERDFFDFYEAARKDKRRVRIEIEVNDFDLPQLGALPWEFMRTPREGHHGSVIFATDPNVTLVRRRARWEPPASVRLGPGERLRVAVAAAAPVSVEGTRLGPVQFREVYDDLLGLEERYQDRIELLDLVTDATASRIDAMLMKQPHVFHFIGHGQLRSADAQGIAEIFLSDGILNHPDPYQAVEFGELFNRHRPAVILLQACQGGASSASDAFTGIASQLVEQGIPVVVAMQFEVTNVTARRFASTFYSALLLGQGLDEAVQEGRRGISLDGAVRHRTRDFATPVIFTRLDEARLVVIGSLGASGATDSASGASLSSGLRSYLRWINDRFGQIELRGIRRPASQVLELALDEIYVPLEATAYERFTPSARPGTSQVTDIAMDELLGIGNRVVLTGGPGSGKTTVLLHIVHTLAEALLTNAPELAWTKLGIEGELPLPVFIPLNAYSTYLKALDANASLRSGDEYGLAAFITYYLKQQQAGADLPDNFFQQALLTGRGIILLLDGLDEVPNESDRIRVRSAVENLVTGRTNLRVVVTCRTAAHKGRTSLGRDFREVRVKPLTWDYVIKLVRQAYGYLYAGQPELREEKVVEILQAIAYLEIERQRRLGPGTPLLIDSPLLLRFLFIVHANYVALPAKRTELYLLATNSMLVPDYGPDEDVSEAIGRLVGGDKDLQLALLRFVAFHMHSQGGGIREGREIAESELTRLLATRPEFARIARDFISLTRLRGTMLEELLGDYRFVHLAFQEFLTARYLAEDMLAAGGMEGLSEFLEAGPLVDSWWREPVLLLVGFLSISTPRTAAALIWYLVGLGDDPKGLDLAFAGTVGMSAAELAAMSLVEWDGAPEELFTAVRDRLARYFELDHRAALLTVRPRFRASGGVALGIFGDDRQAVTSPDSMEFCAIPRGPVCLGGKIAIAADDHYRSQSLLSEQLGHVCEVDYDYWLARFPVTNAQFRPFVEDGGYEQTIFWREAHATGSWQPGQVLRWYWQGSSLQHSWEDGPYDYGLPYNLPNHPAVGISWYEGLAYMRWLGLRWSDMNLLPPEWTLCFPSELEWEKAARGGLKLPAAVLCTPIRELAATSVEPVARENPDAHRMYAWLGSVNVDYLNAADAGIGATNVTGCFPEGASPYGCEEMCGGVWEWTRTLWGRQDTSVQASDEIKFDISFEYPYQPTDGREDLRPDGLWLRVARGGAHNTESKYCRCSFRDMGAPNFRFPWDGLRVAIVPATLLRKNTSVPAQPN